MTSTTYSSIILSRVRDFLPNSLNVSLVCKSFRRPNQSIVTNANKITNIDWLWIESEKNGIPSYLRESIQRAAISTATKRLNWNFLNKHEEEALRHGFWVMLYSVIHGYTFLLEWLYVRKYVMFDDTSAGEHRHVMNMAAAFNQIDVLKWAVNLRQNLQRINNYPPSGSTYPKEITCFAVQSECLPILRHLHAQPEVYWNPEVVYYAIKSKNYLIIQWLRNHGHMSFENTIRCCRFEGVKSWLEYFALYGTPEDIDCALRSATREELDKNKTILLLATHKNLSIDDVKRFTLLCVGSRCGGPTWNDFLYQVSISEWRTLEDTCSLINWALRHGCLYPARYTYQVLYMTNENLNIPEIKGRRIELVKLAIEAGCCWDGDTMSQVLRYNDPEFTSWARNNRCPDEIEFATFEEMAELSPKGLSSP